MPVEPATKRAIAFFDGQNLYRAAKDAFGHHYPNYDPKALAHAICASHGWQLDEVRFYTGVPDQIDDPFWSGFWQSKLRSMSQQSVRVYSRPLRYANQTITLPSGEMRAVLVGREKGIDVRIAIDVMNAALNDRCDVLLLFSQDQDLSEVAREVRAISLRNNRWIKIACAFPVSPTARNRRGINGTDWIRIDRAVYDANLDGLDHRPRRR